MLQQVWVGWQPVRHIAKLRLDACRLKLPLRQLVDGLAKSLDLLA